MLRTALLWVTLLVALLGVVLLSTGQNTWPMILWGSVLFVLTLAERWRYRRRHDAGDDASWQATDEQFIDPETGKLTRVYYRPDSGERRYVVEEKNGSHH